MPPASTSHLAAGRSCADVLPAGGFPSPVCNLLRSTTQLAVVKFRSFATFFVCYSGIRRYSYSIQQCTVLLKHTWYNVLRQAYLWRSVWTSSPRRYCITRYIIRIQCTAMYIYVPGILLLLRLISDNVQHGLQRLSLMTFPERTPRGDSKTTKLLQA